uniref:UDP-glucose 4-epimerase n=1 Tax=Phlebotomus papatasi TaxID=29031 RepID=A0A1B0GNS4_PHLPP
MSVKQTVLVTGGAGYVGSHTILELLNASYKVICVDNLCNAYKEKNATLPESLVRVQELTGKKITFYDVDIRNREALTDVFRKFTTYLTLSGPRYAHDPCRTRTCPSLDCLRAPCSAVAIPLAVR